MNNTNENREVLLKVYHLCQYFKMGNKELKAVDDVSFEIYQSMLYMTANDHTVTTFISKVNVSVQVHVHTRWLSRRLN